MTVDNNAYLEGGVSTGAVYDKAVPLIYSENVIRKLFEAEQLRPLGEDISPLISGAGNKVQIPIEDTTWSVAALTEGTATPISTLDFSAKELTLVWYGDAKQWTIEMEAVAFPYVLNKNRENAASALGVNRDNVIITELLTTTSTALYPFKSDGSKYSSSDVDADATFQYEQIVGADTYMRENQLKLKYVVIHPRQKLALLKDSRFINNNNYNKDVMERGEIKTIDGTQIIVHGSIPSATENSKTVYKALALAEKPFYYAQKQAPMYELDRINILDRSWTFHYFECFGVELKRNEGVVPLKSVGATL